MIQELFFLHHSLILYNNSKSPAKNKEKRHRTAEFVDITASDLSPSVTDSLNWTAVGAISLTDGLAANSTCSVSLRAANKGHLVPTVRDTPEQPGPQKLTPRRRPGVSWPLHPSLWYSKVSTRFFCYSEVKLRLQYAILRWEILMIVVEAIISISHFVYLTFHDFINWSVIRCYKVICGK